MFNPVQCIWLLGLIFQVNLRCLIKTQTDRLTDRKWQTVERQTRRQAAKGDLGGQEADRKG